MDNADIQSFLETLGKRLPPSSHLVLVGGSALILLGSTRRTIDIDFVGDDIRPSKLHRSILEIAREQQIHVEPVPLERFIPLPKGSEKRNIYIGQFGNLKIFVADPYSIALSKLDRGFDTDFDDLLFLVRQGHVALNELESIARIALSQARKFDLNPDMLVHLEELKKRLG